MPMLAAISIAAPAVAPGASSGCAISARGAAAGADRAGAVVRLDHVAGSRQDERAVGVGDHQHRLESAQRTIGAPLLGELDRGAAQRTALLAQLGVEPLEQRDT